MDNMEQQIKKSVVLKTMQINDQKAGMGGLDKEMINRVIYEASKGTPYFTFQEKRQWRIDQRVKEMLLNLEKITDQESAESLEKMHLLSIALERERNLGHSIVHIDMDAFYAAVEMLDNPDLREKPMAVGSSSMLSTSNYHARKFGVRAAMPGFIAKKLCPELVILPCNFGKYKKVSHQIRKIVEEYDPNYVAASLDEMYLDLTDFLYKKHKENFHAKHVDTSDQSDSSESENDNIIGACVELASTQCKKCQLTYKSLTTPERDKMAYAVVHEIRQKIYEGTQLTASAGIAPNTMLAKVCSDQNKPNGQFQICSNVDEVKTFISTLPVKKVSGIGPVQGQLLNALGINTCSDMWNKRDLVDLLFSPTSVNFYMRVALGIGSTTVKSDYVRKSIGVEETFREMHCPQELRKKCQELCEEMVDDLKSHSMIGKVVVLKIKTVKFDVHTRNQSLPLHTSDKEIIVKAAKKLLDTEIKACSPEPLKLRLMGIRMANLIEESSGFGWEKQQAKLKDFLLEKSLSTEENPEQSTSTSSDFTCPVCNAVYQSDLYSLNKHLDECLKAQTTASEEATNSFEVSEHSKILNKNGMTQQSTHFQEPTNTDISSEPCTVLENDSSQNLTSNLNANIDVMCPVCGFEQTHITLNELNAHMDNCLSRSKVREILSAELPGSSQLQKRKIQKSGKLKRKKMRSSSQTSKKIEDYFQV